jgi:aldose 1-epimerase
MIELHSGPARLVVDPHGGRIARRVVEGLRLLVPRVVHERDYGSFPMAPWAGRVRHGRFTFDGVEHQLPINKPPHAIHGTVRGQRWTIDEDTDDAAAISTVLSDPWPFPGRVEQRFELSPDALRLTMEVHARAKPMPASCGWHPWWSRELARGGPLELELHAASMYKLDDEGISTGELVPVTPPPWDDCFTELGEPAAVLRWPGAITVEIHTDCPCVVVFTEPEHAECVEPQSGPPDELNLAPRVVTRDVPLKVHTTWRWEFA